MKIDYSFLKFIPFIGLFCYASKKFFLEHDLDDVTYRRKKRALLKVEIPKEIEIQEKYFKTSAGINLFYSVYKPLHQSKAVICLIHGFADNSSWFVHARAVEYAKQNFTVITMDLEAHGASDGLLVYVSDFQRLVNGAYELIKSHFSQFPNQKFFLSGESMGGAVVLWILLCSQNQNEFAGAILQAPMCKISEDIKPHPIIVYILTSLSNLIPTLPIVPTPDLVDKSFKRREIAILGKQNPLYCAVNPRVKTALEMLRATEFIDKNMEKIITPLLILHGEADEVTVPKSSEELYQRAYSKDKTFKLYPNFWHAIIEGEDPKDASIVWKDILDWLNTRI